MLNNLKVLHNEAFYYWDSVLIQTWHLAVFKRDILWRYLFSIKTSSLITDSFQKEKISPNIEKVYITKGIVYLYNNSGTGYIYYQDLIDQSDQLIRS